MRKTVSIACLLFTGTATLLNAQEVPVPPVEPIQGIVTPQYSGLRIGDIAPQFTLPGEDGRLWSSYNQLGQQAILLVLFGNSPVLVGKEASPQAVLSSIAEAAAQLQKSNVATVAISYANGINLNKINPQFDSLTLRDDEGKLQHLFKGSPTALTLVAIDRAGFLRRIETVREPHKIGSLLLQVGDPTPKMEVGKPAPDFSIPDMNGRVRRLSELRGQRNLLLTFFPKCFTGG